MALLGRDTAVTGPFPKGVLLLETLQGDEALGRPYHFALGLLSKEPSLEPDEVLGKPMAVSIRLGTGDERHFHGIVTSFEKAGTSRVHTRYRAELQPRLSLLRHTLDCRIFNETSQTALDIVTAVLSGRGLTDVETGSVQGRAFRTRDYCVQYRESDLHFVQRLLEEEGIYYFFRHEQSKHVLVLADSISAHAEAVGYDKVLLTPKERKAVGSEEHFWSLKARRALYPGRHAVLAGYDPTKLRAKQLQFGRATSEQLVTAYPFEHYDYPGGLYPTDEAQVEADLRTEVCCADNTITQVEGNTLGLGVGHLVSLRKRSDGDIQPTWKDEDFDKQYLVVGASYSLSIDQYETGTVTDADEPFTAKYQLLDTQIPFRPRNTADKPVLSGPQTAVVVGPPGEEIWTDKLGRVMVQFDWDRKGHHDEKASCWMRVSQAWAGDKWGAIHIPRIGQEVIVRFLEGDPDRPIVTGAVYDRDNMPPYALSANQTQSGIKSRSSKGGAASNFNEIRFEDKKGAEELHTQAEKDMSTVVEHCQTLDVGRNRSIVVGRDETNLVEANRAMTVLANDSVVVGGNHDKTISGNVLQVYGGDHSRKVDGEQTLFVDKNKSEWVKQAHKLTTDKKFRLNQGGTSMIFKGTNVTVDSAGTITMTAGGGSVVIDKTGTITLDSPTSINLVCGASSLAVLPGGAALASPAVTATAGPSTLAMGSDGAGVKSKTVTLEADGVCTVKGSSKLKLQEAEGKKGKGKEAKKVGPDDDADAAASRPAGKKRGKDTKKVLQEGTDWIVIKAVTEGGRPMAGRNLRITTANGTTVEGCTGADGTMSLSGIVKGACKIEWLDKDE